MLNNIINFNNATLITLIISIWSINHLIFVSTRVMVYTSSEREVKLLNNLMPLDKHLNHCTLDSSTFTHWKDWWIHSLTRTSLYATDYEISAINVYWQTMHRGSVSNSTQHEKTACSVEIYRAINRAMSGTTLHEITAA